MQRVFSSLCVTLALLGSASHAVAAEPAHKPAFKLPPSAELHYTIKAKQHGLSIGGDGVLRWSWDASDHSYSILSETRAALFGKIQESKSEGGIDEFGLAPLQFTDKRFRKEPTTTTFKRDTKLISFSESADTYPIKGGEQDRASASWQLLAQARGAPGKFIDGSEWSMFVAGRRDAEPWMFKVVNHEMISTALGKFNAVHLVKAPPPDSKDQQLDIWLAPALEWYPVRLRFADADGDFVDQLLESVDKK
jgi:hypothetical protein